MIGQMVSHYRIDGKLGSGGMGEVYLARDAKLDRTVALKILPTEMASDPERLRRFVQEAKAASALNHANICHIYEIGDAEGTPFIAMEHIEGQTLDAKLNGHPMECAGILDIAVQATDALEEAHSKGIIHRDLKAANIMITPRAQVKILDFGLAKITKPAAQGTDLSTLLQTDTGVVMGTVQYMSPEQALGKRVDHRSDLFSLGVVLYQMVTARLPFSGETATETLSKILHSQPEAIARLNYDVPPDLERMIRKCLEKDPDRRYQSAQELLIDLKNLKRDTESGELAGHTSPPVPAKSPLRHRLLAATALLILATAGGLLYLQAGKHQPIHSIAVLPFLNTKADPDSEYLSDGITDTVINNLSQISQLRVMAHSTMFTFKGKQVDPRKVGHDLNVDAVLTGSMLQQGDDLVIRAELVSTSDGSHLWGEEYDRKLSDILVLQSDLSRDISEKLRLKLTGQEQKQVTKHYTANTEAYQLYLKGRYFWNKRTEDGVERGLELFQQAVDKDPNYALGWAGIADTYVILAGYNFSEVPEREACAKVRQAALRAIAIDGTIAEPHASLAEAKVHDCDFTTAEQEYRRAIELNPNYATAHQWYASYLRLVGRSDQAIAEAQRALELDPLSLIINAELGATYYWARQYDRAIDQDKKILEMDSNFAVAHFYLAQVYERKGMRSEVVSEYLQSEEDASEAARLKQVYATSGWTGFWRAQLESINLPKNHRAAYLALMYVSLGDKDKAFDWIAKMLAEERCTKMTGYDLRFDPAWDPLRSDPRFADLLRRMNLQ